MEQQELQVLRARLDAVERRLRFVVMAWVPSVLAVILLGVAVQQAISQPQVLRTRRSEVVDAAGRVRIGLGVSRDGAVGLSLRDAAGRERIMLAILPDGELGLTLWDASDRMRVGLGVSPAGAPGSPFGTPRAGRASRSLFPKTGRRGSVLGTPRGGSAPGSTFSRAGPRCSLFATLRGACSSRPRRPASRRRVMENHGGPPFGRSWCHRGRGRAARKRRPGAEGPDPGAGCDPSCPDVCIPPPPPDLDSRDIRWRRFRVLPPGPHRFDRDRDGIGCER